ncbi:MAG: cyclic nucleotide-binding domain-containing protein [Rhizobiaceae bacterium]
MGLDRDIRDLARTELFSGFGDDQLRLLAFGAERLSVPTGRVVYREGDAADSAFVLVSGRIGLHVARGGGERRAGSAEPPSILCETALITETARPSTAIAETDCDLLRLNRSQFRRILDEWPELAALVRDRVAASLAAMVDSIARVGGRLRD